MLPSHGENVSDQSGKARMVRAWRAITPVATMLWLVLAVPT
jgi:hypothetical protein